MAATNTLQALCDWGLRVACGKACKILRVIAHYGSLARYEKLRVAHAAGMPGTFSPPPLFSDPDKHHGTCVTHGMPGCRDRWLAVFFEVGGGKNVPGIPGACATLDFAYLVRGPWRTILSQLHEHHGSSQPQGFIPSPKSFQTCKFIISLSAIGKNNAHLSLLRSLFWRSVIQTMIIKT